MATRRAANALLLAAALAAGGIEVRAQLKAGQIYYRLLAKHLGAEAAKLAAAGREK